MNGQLFQFLKIKEKLAACPKQQDEITTARHFLAKKAPHHYYAMPKTGKIGAVLHTFQVFETWKILPAVETLKQPPDHLKLRAVAFAHWPLR